MDNFSDSPDFLLTKVDRSDLKLVEVKYRGSYKQEEIRKIAEEIHGRWHPVTIFLATPEKFYYDSCKNIIENEGRIEQLNADIIDPQIQFYYLNLLNRFEKPEYKTIKDR